jgi:hypothetical protein
VRLLAVLAALVAALIVAAPVRAQSVPPQPCNLAPASNVANARIKFTCVKATRLAAQLNPAYHVFVPAGACNRAHGSTFDCVFHIDLGGNLHVYGNVRVRGRSSNPRLLHGRVTGWSYV